jgi:hypothetical protein
MDRALFATVLVVSACVVGALLVLVYYVGRML